jgi:hypothetical protein
MGALACYVIVALLISAAAWKLVGLWLAVILLSGQAYVVSVVLAGPQKPRL